VYFVAYCYYHLRWIKHIKKRSHDVTSALKLYLTVISTVRIYHFRCLYVDTSVQAVLTSDANLGMVFDAAQLWRRNARVSGCSTDVRQLQDVLADGRRRVELTGDRRDVDRAASPANVRHRWSDGDTRQVDGSSLDHLRALRQNGEMRWYTTNWRNNVQ